MIEPPYKGMWKLLTDGKVVPFIGAGASINATMKVNGKDEGAGGQLPSGKDLAKILAAEASFPSDKDEDLNDLAKVASYYVTVLGRGLLRQLLSETFGKNYRPGPVHNLLADVPGPLLIVTTNYDDLIEQALDDAQKPYYLAVNFTKEDQPEDGASVYWWEPGADKPKAYDVDNIPESLREIKFRASNTGSGKGGPNAAISPIGDATVVYKMHGTVNRRAELWRSYVITEEDYVNFLTSMMTLQAIPTLFKNQFQRSRFLFLGYGLGDWNLRVMLNNLKSGMYRGKGGETPEVSDKNQNSPSDKSWAIQLKPTDLDTALWEQRDVRIFDMDLDTFASNVQKARMPEADPPA